MQALFLPGTAGVEDDVLGRVVRSIGFLLVFACGSGAKDSGWQDALQDIVHAFCPS